MRPTMFENKFQMQYLTMYDTDTIKRQSDQRNIACRPETDAIIYITFNA